MPAKVACACCRKMCESHRVVACGVCSKSFGIDCVDITPAEARKIHAQSGLSWHCSGCASFGSELSGLKAMVAKLQDNIEQLTKLVQSPSLQLDSLPPAATETIIQEIMERTKRSTNCIVFGAREDSSLSGDARADRDAVLVRSLLNAVEVEDAPVKILRLGRLDTTSEQSSRPIKIIMPSDLSVRSIIRNAKKLKGVSSLSGLSVSYDRTKMQSSLYRTVRAELSRRLSAGESNLYIKYKNGIPAIVQSEN